MLFVIRLATRELQIAGLVPEPNEAWMTQVARNLIDPIAGYLRGTRWLIHDRASPFNEQFRQLLRSAQVEGLRLPARSPNLNAYAERFVRTIRQGCLDRMVFFGEAALRRSVEEFVIHYNQKRNHQSWGIESSTRCFRSFQRTVTFAVANGSADCFDFITERQPKIVDMSFWTLRG